MAGLVSRTDDWNADLPWILEVGNDGIILFEDDAHERGRKQDELRRQGFQVIGGSSFGDRLENDRKYAQSVLRDIGLPVAPMYEFDTLAEATSFVEAHPGRYVLKFSGDAFCASDNYVGRMRDGRDVVAVLAAKFRQSKTERVSFVLMTYVDGMEWASAPILTESDFLRRRVLTGNTKNSAQETSAS